MGKKEAVQQKWKKGGSATKWEKRRQCNKQKIENTDF